jgi:uncharacterized protein DUF6634
MTGDEKIVAALADRDRIAEGWEPGEAELAGAPVISHYVAHTDGEHLILTGVITGHPRIPDGLATTSAVVAIDKNRLWVRTVGRWYRLGRRAFETAQ